MCSWHKQFPHVIWIGPQWATVPDGTRKVKPIWILLKQETLSGSGINWAICKSAPLCFLQAGCPSWRPTNSIKALKAITTGNTFEFKYHYQLASLIPFKQLSVSPLPGCKLSLTIQSKATSQVVQPSQNFTEVKTMSSDLGRFNIELVSQTKTNTWF